MKIKIFLLVILMTFIFQSKLFPLITSRIEGVVTDAETCEVINKVKVYLYIYREGAYARRPHYNTTTDKNGKFFFDDLKNDRYFLKCEHEDYLLSIPERKLSLPDLSRIVNLINLDQGQIKYLEIRLSRGGKIKGRVLLKDENGVSGVDYAAINIENDMVKNERDPLFPSVDSNGNFFIGSLIPDDNYMMQINYPGFPEFKTSLSVKKGETTYIEHTFDATDKTGVFGTVTLEGKPHDDCGVSIWDIDNNKKVSRIDANVEGNFMIKDMNPGYYRVLFIYIDANKNIHKKSRYIRLKKNEMKQIDIDF